MVERFDYKKHGTLEEFLEERFEPVEELLEELARTKQVKADEFQETAESSVRNFIQNVQSGFVGAKDAIKEQMEIVKRELSETRARKNELEDDERKEEHHHEKMSSIIYKIMYVAVEFGAMLIFIYGIDVIMPGMPRYQYHCSCWRRHTP